MTKPDPVATWRAAVAARPGEAVIHLGLATALWQAGQRHEAVASLRQAVALDPAHAAAQNNLGNALVELGDLAAGLAQYRAGLRRSPDNPDLHANLANALMRAGITTEAEQEYRRALALQPDHAAAMNNLGNCLRTQGDHTAALALYQSALAIRPDQFGTQNNIASALLALHRPIEAELWLRRVLTALPDYAEAANNLGGALLAQDRLEEAAHWFARAHTLDPTLVQARFGLAMAQLGMGDFAAGWHAYESRWDDPRFLEGEPPERLPPTLPRWHGEDIAGRRILLLAEQGLGDTIQFARFAPLVAGRGGDVVMAVDPLLVDLLRPLAETIPFGAAHGASLFCPLMSLPHLFATTLQTIPPLSLSADPARIARWQSRLGPRTRRRIGLAISGSADHTDDAQRSIPAARFARLFARLDADWHLLQPEIRDSDRPHLNHVALHTETLTDFSETAALASLMDDVISVDTSVAHLAAAIGVPTTILLPYAADWRWLRARNDSPWYPAARLHRQTTPGDWSIIETLS